MVRYIALALVLLCLGFAAYSPALEGGPVWDDHLLLEQNPTVAGTTPPIDAFHQPFTPFPVFFRPATALVLRASVRKVGLAGDRAPARADAPPLTAPDLRTVHRLAVLLHICVALGLASLSRWAGAGPWSSSIAALLFLLHPALSEAVAWMSGLGDLLAAFGLVTGGVLLLARRSGPEEPGSGRSARGGVGRGVVEGVLATVFIGLAVFSKESALLVPPLLWGAAWTTRRETAECRARLFTSLLGIGSVLVLYAALRLGTVTNGFGAGASIDPIRALVTLGTYTRLLILPTTLPGAPEFQPLLDLHPLVDRPSGLDPRYLWAVLGAFGTLALIVRSIAPPRRTLLGGLWLLLTFLPPWLLVPPSSPILAERYLYLPSIGIALALAAMATQIASRSRSTVPARVRLVIPILAIVTAGIAFGITRNRATDWSAEETILDRSLSRDPRNVAIAVNRGFLLRTSGDAGGARALYARTIEAVDAGPPFYLSEHGRTAWNRLLFEAATLATEAGEARDAEALFRRALEVDPTDERSMASLSALLGNQGRLEEVVGLLTRGVEIHPRSARLRGNLARALSLLGRTEEAERQYRSILEIDPDNEEARSRIRTGR